MELGRRDPQGYYVLVLPRNVLDLLASFEGVLVEDLDSEHVIVRVKSRSLAIRILRRAGKLMNG